MTVWDRQAGTTFLVDSGADESVYPATKADRQRPRSADLVAANGSVIRTWGKKSINLQLGNGRAFVQEMWVAEVTQPILGADFFIKNCLAMDLGGRRLLGLNHLPPIPARAVCSASKVCGLHQLRDGFEAILDEFPDLLVPKFHSTSPKHPVRHHIVTRGPPVHAGLAALMQKNSLSQSLSLLKWNN